MKRITILGLCLLVTCVTSAVAAGSASAALPELGRCVKVTGVVKGKKTEYNGAYGSNRCLHLQVAHRGRYEWLPGPGAKNKFYATGLEPEPTLETVGGAKVSCSSLSFRAAEYTGPKSAKVEKVFFAGCEASAGVPCQSNPAKEGEIEGTGAFTMELAYIKGGEKPVAGWDLKREGAAFVYTCGKLPELRNTQTVEGSVIAPLASGSEYDVNRMSLKGLLKYKGKAGKQLPESFEGGPKDTLTTTTVTGTAKTVEQTSLTTNLELESGLGELGIENPENQEPLEVKISGQVAGA